MPVHVSNQTIIKNSFLEVILFKEESAIVVNTLKSYIPKDVFKDTFTSLEPHITGNQVNKLIFDKSALSVFDQEAMEWYHVHWKENMFAKGLKHHRKILPDSDFFKNSVKAGRKKIASKYPSFSFDKLDIQYRNSVAEALAD